METAWIQVFILTLVECVAPTGKSVCQAQQFELQFLGRDDCEYALQQLIAAKDELDYVIVDRQKSNCAPSAAQAETYASINTIDAANKGRPGWRSPVATKNRARPVNIEHHDRLAELQPCAETNGIAPCKIGEVIVEAAIGDSVEVWHKK